MSMLNFRYGKFNGLFNNDGSNKLPLNEGTVYITTDEKAMYVDLHNGTNVERIRLSQIVNIPTITAWNDLKPPFSTEAFYYIVEANALLKYTGTEWTQINSTSELEQSLGQLSQTVSQLSQTVSNNATKMNTHIGTTTGNPHGVTKADVGLDKVENKSASDLKTEFKATSVSSSETGFTTGAQVHSAVQGVTQTLSAHTTNKNNPHEVTKAQVGLGDVDNTADMDKPVSTAQAQAITDAKNALLGNSSSAAGSATISGANKAAAAAKSYAEGVQTNLNTHKSDKDNPHEVTKAQVGLGDVDNTSDVNKPVSTAQKTYIDEADAALLGTTNDASGAATIHGALKAAAAADSKAGGVQTNLNTHTTNKNNPHEVTAAQLGVGDFKDQTRAGIKTAWTGSIADGNTGFTTGDAVFEYIKSLKDGYTGSLDDLNDAIGNNATDIASLGTTVSNLDTRLTTALQTADALKYIGTVSAFSGLPAVSSNPAPQNGWTYKATAKFSLTAAQSATNKAVTVYIGDLLIATGTETNGVITSDLKWDHIPSGYVADYNPKFSLSGADTSGTGGVDSNNEVSINLTSGAASATGDLGKIAFKTNGDSAIRITATNTASNAASLTLSLAWGTF